MIIKIDRVDFLNAINDSNLKLTASDVRQIMDALVTQADSVTIDREDLDNDTTEE